MSVPSYPDQRTHEDNQFSDNLDAVFGQFLSRNTDLSIPMTPNQAYPREESAIMSEAPELIDGFGGVERPDYHYSEQGFPGWDALGAFALNESSGYVDPSQAFVFNGSSGYVDPSQAFVLNGSSGYVEPGQFQISPPQVIVAPPMQVNQVPWTSFTGLTGYDPAARDYMSGEIAPWASQQNPHKSATLSQSQLPAMPSDNFTSYPLHAAVWTPNPANILPNTEPRVAGKYASAPALVTATTGGPVRNIGSGSNRRRDEPYRASFAHKSRDRAHEMTNVNIATEIQGFPESRPRYRVPTMPVAHNTESGSAIVSSAVGDISLSASQAADFSVDEPKEQFFRKEWPPFTAGEADRREWWHLAERHCRDAWESHINLSSLPVNTALKLGRNDEEIKTHFAREVESAWEDVEKGILAYEALRPGGRCQDLELIVSAEVHHRAYHWATSNGSPALWYEGEHICCLREAFEREDTRGFPWSFGVSRASGLPKRSRDGEKVYASTRPAQHRERKKWEMPIEQLRLIPDVDKASRDICKARAVECIRRAVFDKETACSLACPPEGRLSEPSGVMHKVVRFCQGVPFRLEQSEPAEVR